MLGHLTDWLAIHYNNPPLIVRQTALGFWELKWAEKKETCVRKTHSSISEDSCLVSDAGSGTVSYGLS